MDDAPMDDVDYTNWTRDAESYRENEKVRRENGLRAQFALALSPDGEPAGSSTLFVQLDRPFLLYQGNTAVLAEHRGKALGRWLKAANYMATAAWASEYEVIETFNAQSNPWMLAINTDMGFRPHRLPSRPCHNRHQTERLNRESRREVDDENPDWRRMVLRGYLRGIPGLRYEGRGQC